MSRDIFLSFRRRKPRIPSGQMEVDNMKDRQQLRIEVELKAGHLTRRELMGTSVLGAGIARHSAASLEAQSRPRPRTAAARRQGRRIIDTHVHLWKLPRNAAPMNDNATFPTGCCGSVPWMEVDRLTPDYDARVGGPEVDKLVLIESSVGVPADKIIQSNLWMLQTAAADGKILSVVGNLDITQDAGELCPAGDPVGGEPEMGGHPHRQRHFPSQRAAHVFQYSAECDDRI